jgi:NADPH2:quinone reductase
MRAWVLERTGDPREVLKLVDVPTPEIGAGQLLVEVEMAGIMYPDLLLVRGEYQISLPLPSTPGGELVGRVCAAAPGTGIEVGTRVMATTFGAHGSFAQLAPVSASHSQPIPDDLPAPQAVALPTNYVTAHLALHRRAHLRPREVVIVIGGAGGVGSATIELAHAAEAVVVGVDIGAQRAKVCVEVGADVGVDSTRDDLADVVREVSGGRGADVVVDIVGGDLFDVARRLVAFEGRIVIVGYTSGVIPQLRLNQLVLRSFTVMGVNAMVTLFDHPEIHEQSRRAVIDLLAGGAIAPRISVVHPFDQVPHALVELAERQVPGKAVVDVRSVLVSQMDPGG